MNQNLKQKNVSLQIPTITFNMNKQFPFKKKIPIGKPKWYEKLSVGFNSNLKNNLNIGDSLLFTETALDQMQNGLQYTVPVSVSSKLLNYIIFSPSFNYTGRVYSKYLEQNWYDDEIVSGDTIKEAGFYTDTITGLNHLAEFNVAASFSTTLYGMIQFKKSRVAAFRHVLKPSASISFRPDFGKPRWGYYSTDSSKYSYDSDSLMIYDYMFSRYGNGIFGTPSPGEAGVISLNLQNNFEMKLHSKDTTEEFKKIVLLDNLRFGSSYNIMADSIKWNPITIAATTKFFKKLSFQYTGLLELYKRDESGRLINTTFLERERQLGHLARSQVSLSGQINSKMFGKDKDKKGSNNTEKSQDKGLRKDGFQSDKNLSDLKEEQNAVNDYDFKAPWSITLRYTFNYISNYDTKIQDYKSTFVQTVNSSINLTLDEKWKIGTTLNYDIIKRELTTWNMNFHRDLHCWEMSFNFVPFGPYQSYMFRINIKSSIFQGLEWKKQNSWRDNIDFGDF